MDLVSHVSSGICCGAAWTSLAHRPRMREPLLLALGVLLPDMDGATVLFNHQVYYSQDWYSHHGVLHSPLGAALILSGACLVSRALGAGRRLAPGTAAWILFGWLLHLVEDLPSPGEPWGGLPLLWPFSGRRFGGWAHIWWLNEYLVLLLCSGALLAILGVLLARMLSAKWSNRVAFATFLVAVGVLSQAAVFVAVSRYESLPQWKAYQHDLLGDQAWSLVYGIDHSLDFLWRRQVLGASPPQR